MNWTMDLSRVAPEVRRSVIFGLQHEDQARHALGLLEQRRLKQFHDQMAVPGQLNTELGRQTMTLSRDQWIRFMQKYGQRCWSDPDFAPWVRKQTAHADLRVKDVGLKVQVGYTGA
jgi:hypothetical protein